MSGRAGRFGLAKPSHPPLKYYPICLFLWDTFKIVIDIVKKKVQTFLTVQFSGGLMNPLLYKFANVIGCGGCQWWLAAVGDDRWQ